MVTKETRQKMSDSAKMAFRPYYTEEYKQKLSLAHKGYKHSPETIEKMSESRKWYTHSPETRKKISEKGKGRKLNLTEEQRKRKSELLKGKPAWNKGIPHTEEHKRKLSKARKGKTIEEFYGSKEKAEQINQKRVESRKGYKHSDETKRKIGDKSKGRKHTLESKKKLSLSHKGKPSHMKGKHHTPETRKKISEANIKRLQENGLIFKPSKPEIEAENILKKYNLNYKKQFPIKYLNSYRLYDFLLPDYNILLEIDGTYWHSKNIKDEDIKGKRFQDMRINDHIKDKLAQEQGYTLIRIWEDELNKLENYCSDEIYLAKEVS